MQSAMIFLVAAVPVVACGAGPAPAPAAVAAPLATQAPVSPAPKVVVSRCVAQPSTVYGDEVVVFGVEGQGSAGADVEVEAYDQRQQRVFRGRAPVPGQLRLPDLPSGDFTLRIPASTVSCRVTVNRELQRATPAPR